MTSRSLVAILVATLASAAIWAMSLVLAGRAEPWDAEFLFYVFSLFAAGLVSGTVVPEPLWAHYIGSLVGQVGYELLFLNIGPLFVLGVVFLLGYSLLFLAGAAVGALVRRKLGSTRAVSAEIDR
jgi:hypothetical protein